METLDYNAPTIRSASKWRRRYAVGIPAIALWHFAGSMIFLVKYYPHWVLDYIAYSYDQRNDFYRPDRVLTCFVMTYEFPMVWLGRVGGFIMLGENAEFAMFAAINAVLWAGFAMSLWHAASAMRELCRQRKAKWMGVLK